MDNATILANEAAALSVLALSMAAMVVLPRILRAVAKPAMPRACRRSPRA